MSGKSEANLIVVGAFAVFFLFCWYFGKHQDDIKLHSLASNADTISTTLAAWSAASLQETNPPTIKRDIKAEVSRRIRIEIKEDYGEEVDGKLPIHRDVSRLVDLAGWSEAHEGEPCDAVLTVTAVVHGLYAPYTNGIYCTGAYVRGTIHVEKSDRVIFDRSFVGHVPPQKTTLWGGPHPGFVIQQCEKAYAFSFVPTFMDAVAVTLGPDPLIFTYSLPGAHMDDELLGCFRGHKAAQAALLRMGDSALPALSRTREKLKSSNSQSPPLKGVSRSQIADDCLEAIVKIHLGMGIDYSLLSNAYQAGKVNLQMEACRFAMPESGCQHLTNISLLTLEQRKMNGWTRFDDVRLWLQDVRDPRIVPFLIQSYRSDPNSLCFSSKESYSGGVGWFAYEAGATTLNSIAEEMRDLRFVDILIETLRKENPDSNGLLWSARALESITGQDMGSNYASADAWRDWWEGHSETKFDRMTGWAK